VFAVADAWYDLVLPQLITLAVICLGAVLLWLARGRLVQLVGELGIQKIGAFGVDLQFAEQQTTAAYKKQNLEPPSQEDKAAIRDAVSLLAPLVAQSNVLWVDDDPGGNAIERSTFLSLGVGVQAARSTQEGLDELTDSRQSFELVISDWRRENENDSEDEPAGLELVREMRERDLPQRVIFYHGPVEGTQLESRRRRAFEAGAVGATGSPGELVRWTLLELTRVVLDSPSPIQLRQRERVAAAAAYKDRS